MFRGETPGSGFRLIELIDQKCECRFCQILTAFQVGFGTDLDVMPMYVRGLVLEVEQKP